jgi:hypothetical protein
MSDSQNRFKKEAGLFDSPIINPSENNSFQKKKNLKKWDEKMTKRFIALETICPEIKYFSADFESWAREVFESDSEEYSAAIKLARKLSKTESLLYSIISMMTDMAKTGEINSKEVKAFENTFLKLAQDAGFGLEVKADCLSGCTCSPDANCPDDEKCDNCKSCMTSRHLEKESQSNEFPHQAVDEEAEAENSDPEDFTDKETEEAATEENKETEEGFDYQMEYSLEKNEAGKFHWQATATGAGYNTIEEAEEDLKHIFKNAIDRMDLEEEIEEQLETEEKAEGQEDLEEEACDMMAENHHGQEIAHQDLGDSDKPKWFNKTFNEASEEQLETLEAALEENNIFALLSKKAKTLKIHGSEKEVNNIINQIFGE